MIERKRKITIFLAQKHRKNSFSENKFWNVQKMYFLAKNLCIFVPNYD